MTKRSCTVGVLLSVLALAGWAQDGTFARGVSEHYLVLSDAGAPIATAVAQGMESALRLYNDLLHFDTSGLSTTKLRIRLFAKKTDFDAYLATVISSTRRNYVYVHYSSPERSELVAYQKDDLRDMVYTLMSQGFIQFLKTYVPDAPLWLQEGTALYVANTHYRPEDGALVWKPNFGWLDTVRRLERDGGLIPFGDLITMTREQAAQRIDVFYPEAWALVHFLLEADSRTYNRVFWDSVAVLNAASTLGENSVAVARRAFAWLEPQTLAGDFRLFIGGLESFADLVQSGVDSYKAGRLAEAEDAFNQATVLEETNHVPYYYLGLIRYGQRKYFDAARYYEQAQRYGADAGLVSYALGVNAYANSELDAATRFLEDAAKKDPTRYGAEVAKLQERIRAER
jgi:tetratricopeptide (TPR) repeat protein